MLARKDSIAQPAGWFGIVQNPRTFKVKYPEWIRGGSAAVWSFHQPDQVIPAGSDKSGFELESELRPGFTLGYFRKAESIEAKVATHGNVPKPVKDQIDSLLAVEYNSRTLLTLGPKFDKFGTDQAIAGDFIEGINVLTRMAKLSADSEFVKGTLAELKRITPEAGASTASFTVPAGTPLETQILEALRISLKLQ